MAKVLIYNNFLQQGEKSVLAFENSEKHEYTSVGPGCWQANPYGKRKHMGLKDLIKRTVACIKVWMAWRKFNVLILDSATSAFFICALSFIRKGHRKLIISSFNVPRRRNGVWLLLGKILFRKVDIFFVHSKADIGLASDLYNLQKNRFLYRPVVRSAPTEGLPDREYVFEDQRPYILSLGGNARDYATFMSAIETTSLCAIVVAREHNLAGLRIPNNVRAFCNIPLEQCDKLVDKCMFTVFTFDGSEPSCGQISFVTSFMLGKPTICTDWICAHDYVKDGDNGLFAKMKDAEDIRKKMLMLASDRKLYDKLCSGAHSWATHNTNPLVCQQIIDNLVTKLMTE